MIYLLALVAGFAGAVAGWTVAFVVAAALMGGSGVDRAMLAFWGFGLLGGIIGFVLGLVAAWLISRRYARKPIRLGRLALVVVGIVVGLNVLAAVVSGLSNLKEFLNIGGPDPGIVFEIRLPAGQQLPADKDAVIVLMRIGAQEKPAWIDKERIREEDGRAFVGGVAILTDRDPDTALILVLPNEPRRIFKLTLSRWVLPSREFGPWQRADAIEPPAGGDTTELRYYIN